MARISDGAGEHARVVRCGAAHRDDATLCEGDRAAVRIVVGADEVLACVHHGARLYASVEGARAYPVGGPEGPHAGAAIEVAHRAMGMDPFFWMRGSAVAEPGPV